MKLTFLRHFKPKVEKDKPVEEWGLSKTGKEKMQQMLNTDTFKNITKIFTSPENKAKVTAKKIGKKYNIPVIETSLLSEVDRSKEGFIEGNYVKIVEKYLSNNFEFNYKWESIDSVKARGKKFIENLDHERGHILIVSHGMFLSILLSPYFKKDRVQFWKKLSFGELIKIDYSKLEKAVLAKQYF